MAPSVAVNGAVSEHESVRDESNPTPVYGRDPPLSSCPERIAIVGMGCRWPGELSSPSRLWDFLEAEGFAWSEFTKDKFNLEGYYHPNAERPGSINTKGGFLFKDDMRKFDHSLFGITPLEVISMDPAQRKLLECVYEAFESSGTPLEKASGSRTGCFVGNFNYDHQLMQSRDTDYPLPYASTGGGIAILANRINYIFNLKGPSLTLDNACSSSMYALHLACRALQVNDCDGAIVGGSNLISTLETQLYSTKLGALSPTSVCHTFDSRADGYARADGFGVLYVKRLADAVRDRDPIRAVIRGTAFNANGKTGGISHPSPEGQAAVIQQAYEMAGGLDPNMTGYFECHGTGTPVGDPLEVSAIGKVFAAGRTNDPLLIGSIKTNLGHSESASGIAGVMKAVLAIEHGVIPATIGLVKPNPNIDFDGCRVKVVTKATPWPRSKPFRRVSVNSFGYGGANAHAILEGIDSIVPGYRYARRKLDVLTIEVPYMNGQSNGASDGLNSHPNGHSNDYSNGHSNGHSNGYSNGHSNGYSNGHTYECERTDFLLVFSANDETALKATVASMRDVGDSYSILDLSYTLGVRRSQLRHRGFAVASEDTVRESLDEANVTTGKKTANIAGSALFVFTGQGAQWAQMGKDLMESFPSFLHTVRKMDHVLQALAEPPDWTIEDALREPNESSKVNEPALSQPLTTAVQIALVRLLSAWNIRPDATVGHSSGEIAGCYAAGYLDLDEAILTAYFRGKIVSQGMQSGSMMAVGLGAGEVAPYLDGYDQSEVVVACHNSPASVTLSGEDDAIAEVKRRLDEKSVFCRKLRTGGKAYHSHQMQELGWLYAKALASIPNRTRPLRSKRGPRFVSSVTGQPYTADHVESLYWKENLESPVLFNQALQHAVTHKEYDSIIEIGPHSALAGPIRQIRAAAVEDNGKFPPYYASLVRGQSGTKSLLTLAGNLFIMGFPIDLERVNSLEQLDGKNGVSKKGYVIPDLPTYPYTYGPVLYRENRPNKEWRLRKHLRHDILGSLQAGGIKDEPTWRNVLRIKDVPWLEDHKLNAEIVFPAAGFLAMAIEAVMQFHPERESDRQIVGFSLRNVAINAALVVPDDDHGVETLLRLKPLILTNNKTSERWYEFAVSAVVADKGVEHCRGTVGVEHERHDTTSSTDALEALSTPVDTDVWYKSFSDRGLNYGPMFRGLSNIYSNPNINRARATTLLKLTENIPDESRYLIHPATLDTCLQLALIAVYNGKIEKFQQAFVPLVVDELSLWVPSMEENVKTAHVESWGCTKGLRGAYCGFSLRNEAGETLAELNNLRCVAYDGGAAPENVKRNPYTRLVWKPDITSLTPANSSALFPRIVSVDEIAPVFQKLERLALHVVVQFLKRNEPFLNGRTFEHHLTKFLEWARRSMDLAAQGKLDCGHEAVTASPDEAEAIIDQLSTELYDAATESRLVKRMHHNLRDIFEGVKTGIQVALEDNFLTELYVSARGIAGAYPYMDKVVDLLAHSNPRMNILEVGAGTGGATRRVLKVIGAGQGFRRYNSYTFTDVTPGFLAAAEQEFSACKGMRYKTLDIEEDPASQHDGEPFDLVVASNVLHATANMTKTLQHTRKLLKPGGKLLLVEVTRDYVSFGLALGTFTDFWDAEDQRLMGPFLSQEQWKRVLRETGFSGFDVLVNDYDAPHSRSSVILSTAVTPTPDIPRPLDDERDTLTLVHRHRPTAFTSQLEAYALERGWKTERRPITGDFSDKPRTIILADLEGPFLATMTRDEFQALQRLVRNVSSALWVTNGGLLKGRCPQDAMWAGLLRTIVNESPSFRCHALDLDSNVERPEPETLELVLSQEERLREGHEGEDLDYRVDGGIVHVSRLVDELELNTSFQQRNHLVLDTQELRLDSQGPLMLGVGKPGLLDSLYFTRDKSFGAVLGANEVEIEVKAIGLNTQDAAAIMGKLDSDTFSTESAGIVSAVGRNVTRFKTGDRVFGVTPGKLGNFARAPEVSLEKMAADDSFTEMASIPVVYATALYAFNHLARLSEGETVLIQSATGDIGLAAISVAQLIGAEIYATVENAEQRAHLTQTHAIPDFRVFSSQDMSGPKRLLQATGGRGVDVVLALATGDQLDETWRCIAPFGRFIDVGRSDVCNHGMLSLEVFKRNATFSSFDLASVNQMKPELCGRLLAKANALYRAGKIKPLPVTAFDVSELEAALAGFVKGAHIGKTVVSLDRPETLLKIRPSPEDIRLRQDASYLLVGCLGGLGRSISRWMAQNGAAELIYLARSGASRPETRALICELDALGVSVTVVKGSVTEMADVKKAVASANKPIRGVIQAAMVLSDQLFDRMTWAQFVAVTGPKVRGTLNLHEALLGQPLDFFTMTSSLVTMIGTASQGNYSAACAFLDSFARHRHSAGLPALSLALGMILDVGYVSRLPEVQHFVKRNGLYGTPEREFLDQFSATFGVPSNASVSCAQDVAAAAHLLMGLDPAGVHALRREGYADTPMWYSDPRFGIVVQAVQDTFLDRSATGSATTGSSASAVDRWRTAPAEEFRSAVEEAIRERLAKLLFIAPDAIEAAKSVVDYGADSMIAAELRNWLFKTFRMDIPFLELLSPNTKIGGLADRVQNTAR